MSKIGIMIPTYNRPDLIRRSVLQFITQTRKPDVICVHQNGNGDSYEWAIEDLRLWVNIIWITTPTQLRQNDWYAVPLTYLINDGCDIFFWVDHDDIYQINHVERCVNELKFYKSNSVISKKCNILYIGNSSYKYAPSTQVDMGGTEGMSSSLAFDIFFAIQLKDDLINDQDINIADNVLAKVTMPKFKNFKSDVTTSTYVSHAGSYSSSNWVSGMT
jgi:GT2 family glycosyltransferase